MKKKLIPENIIAAIDIGTTKICVLVAQQLDNENFEIVGIGRAPSIGLARGVVVDILPAMHSIKTALKEAELMAGLSIESAYIGISGAHINSLTSQGMVAVKHGEVRAYDIAQVLAAARATPIPEGQHIIHVLPQFYTIDSHHHVRDPLGMYGVRLEAQVHIITGALASVQNLIRCCEMAGVKVRDIILEPLASADAVLSVDEKELGVALLDIGGGTSDLALYQQGSVRYTHIFPIAGNLFTNDIALCLRTTLKDAERIKKEHGLVYRPFLTHDVALDVELVYGNALQEIGQYELVAILESRAQELLMLLKREIEEHHLETFIHSGLVLTGGGSLLTGIQELAQDMLQIPVRIGRPHVPPAFRETLENPIYATGYGLLVQAVKKNKHAPLGHLSGPIMSRVFSRMKSWVLDFF